MDEKKLRDVISEVVRREIRTAIQGNKTRVLPVGCYSISDAARLWNSTRHIVTRAELQGKVKVFREIGKRPYITEDEINRVQGLIDKGNSPL